MKHGWLLGILGFSALALAISYTAFAQIDREPSSNPQIEVVFPTQLPPLIVVFPTQIPPIPFVLATATPAPPEPVNTPIPSTPGPTIPPTRTSIQEGFEGYLNYGEQYLLPDGLKASVESVRITEVGNVTIINISASIENSSPDLMDGGRFALYYEGKADEESLDTMGFEKEIIWYAHPDGSQGITYHPKGWARFVEAYRLESFNNLTPLQTMSRYFTINIQSLDPQGKLYLVYPRPYSVKRHNENYDSQAGELPPDELVWRIK